MIGILILQQKLYRSQLKISDGSIIEDERTVLLLRVGRSSASAKFVQLSSASGYTLSDWRSSLMVVMSKDPALPASVYYRDKNGNLRSFDRKTSESILAAAGKGDKIVQVGCGVRAPEFDLQNMKKLKRGRSAEKDIFIGIPWNAKIFKAAGSLKDSIRRKILEMALDRIRGEQSLNKILDLKTVPARSVRENPYLVRGHSAYENFLDSLLNATLCSSFAGEALYDAILEFASHGATNANLLVLENQGVRLVFHGTNEASMDNILNTGLLPEYRKSGNQEWFGVHYTVSLEYTRRWRPDRTPASKVLFFMVLCPVDCQTYVTSVSNLFQLPLAEITLDNQLPKMPPLL